MRSFRTFSIITISVGVAAGCSLVNAFDDVTPPREVVYTSTPKTEEPFAEAGNTATDAGADAPETGSTVDHAVLVVGGVVEVPDAGGRRDPVLTVIDPTDGHEIGTRETFHVAGIAHDANRELWYIFEAPTSFIAGPADVVQLHIRKLDSKTGAWTELSKSVVPPLVYYDSIAVTNDRLTFVAHPAEAGGSPRMITMNTSNPASPQQVDDRTLAALPAGMVATPASKEISGGQVSLVNVGTAAAGECEAGVCAAKLRRFLVPNSGPVTEQGGVTFGSMSQFGSISSGSLVCGGGPDELFILPLGGATPKSLHQIEYLSNTVKSTLTFTMNAGTTLLRRAAVDNKRRIVFVIEGNNDTNLYAVPLDGNAGDAGAFKANVRHSGQSVYYDPASQTAFAPFNQGDSHTFSAFKVVVNNGSVELRERIAPPDGDWNAPSDLRPILLGIHNPPPAVICQ